MCEVFSRMLCPPVYLDVSFVQLVSSVGWVTNHTRCLTDIWGRKFKSRCGVESVDTDLKGRKVVKVGHSH